ncbi:MAG: PRD domain-containing protein, partial [Longicatena sp.]
IITTTIQKYNCHIEDTYADNVYLNITIALSRMRNDYHMEKVDKTGIQVESIEYLIAKEICDQYARHYTISIYPDDIAYITTLILGQVKPLLLGVNGTDTNRINDQFRKEISDILMKTFHYYMLNIDYESFLHNFAMHVDALITRAKHHQSVNNAIGESIKSSCPFIYDVAVYLAKELEEKYDITISDDEIGFISVHIGFVIENSTKEHHLIKVLLLCNNYHQSANL